MVRMERYSTDDLQAANQMTRSVMEKSAFVKWLMKVIGAFGVALLLAGQYYN